MGGRRIFSKQNATNKGQVCCAHRLSALAAQQVLLPATSRRQRNNSDDDATAAAAATADCDIVLVPAATAPRLFSVLWGAVREALVAERGPRGMMATGEV